MKDLGKVKVYFLSKNIRRKACSNKIKRRKEEKIKKKKEKEGE